MAEKSKSGVICLVNSTKSWGGGEKWHYSHAKALAERGFKIVMVVWPNGELHKKIADLKGVEVVPFAMGNLSFLNLIKIERLKSILINYHVDSVIFNDSAGLKIGSIAAKSAGIKNIIYRRGLAKEVKKSILNTWIFSKALTGIIANSEETKKTICTNYPDVNSKIKVIYNGFPLEEFLSGSKEAIYQKQGDEIVIGNAGRLSAQKGQEYLIELGTELKRVGLNFKILIAGKGELEEELKNKVSEKGLESHILFLGFVEHMRRFMDSIDIFVFPSIYEGFGYVLAEAMACRKPIVCFDITSNPELVMNEVNGYLIPSGDVNEMVEKVKLLANDESKRHEMGDNGYDLVKSKFAPSVAINELIDFLNMPAGPLQQ